MEMKIVNHIKIDGQEYLFEELSAERKKGTEAPAFMAIPAISGSSVETMTSSKASDERAASIE